METRFTRVNPPKESELPDWHNERVHVVTDKPCPVDPTHLPIKYRANGRCAQCQLASAHRAKVAGNPGRKQELREYVRFVYEDEHKFLKSGSKSYRVIGSVKRGEGALWTNNDDGSRASKAREAMRVGLLADSYPERNPDHTKACEHVIVDDVPHEDIMRDVRLSIDIANLALDLMRAGSPELVASVSQLLPEIAEGLGIEWSSD